MITPAAFFSNCGRAWGADPRASGWLTSARRTDRDREIPRPRRFLLPAIVLLSLLSGGTAQADDSNLPLQVTDLNGDGVVDCAGACEGDIYTIRDFNDALALLYGGLHHNGIKDCNSDARRTLVAQWGRLFNCRGGCPDGLQHAWRNADLSDDTSSFLDMVGLSPMPPQRWHGRRPAIIDFCNAYSDPPVPRFGGDSDFLDNDPIRIPCDPHEDVCGADGTLGLVLPIVPPANLSSEDNYPSSECTEGVFEKVHGKSGLCPDGRPPSFGLCSIPVLQGDSGSTDFRCTNSSANCPTEAPLNADCRAYNLTARTENGAIQKDQRGRDVRGAFFRIHASNSVTGETCNAATAENEITCLASQAPDSVGLAYGGATPPVRIVASGDFFDNKYVKTLGFISDAYGALQAGVAIFEFLKDPAKFFSGDSDIDRAKEEIIKAVNDVEVEGLIGDVQGVIATFQKVRDNPTNTNDPILTNLVIRDADAAYFKIAEIINRGNLSKTYQLAPAFNALAATEAMALKLNGFDGAASDLLQKTLQYNYLMVGADLIDIPDCACTGECERLRNDTSLGKLLWKKFRFPTVSCGTPDQPGIGPLVLESNLEFCDANTPAYCWFDGSPVIPVLGPGGVVTRRPDDPNGFDGRQSSPDQLPKCYNQTVSQAVSTFDKDDVVDLIKQAISFANADGFRSVAEVHFTGVVPPFTTPILPLRFSSTTVILDASFRRQPPVPTRLQNPVCPVP